MRNRIRARQALTIISTLTALATGLARRLSHAARHAHDWLAALADRHQSPARVARSTTHMEAGR